MIDVRSLTFKYKKTPVLKGLTFHVNKGEIFGFLGPSGAGKSTLQKLLIGLLPKYGGTATVMGQHCDSLKRSFFTRVGVDFEVSTLYEQMTARENLQFFASLYSRPCFEIEPLLERVGLNQKANMRVAAYSKGMKSRLSFAKAILHNPDLIFLDEPTEGLDPTNAAYMKDIIKGLATQGKTIVLTTHNMQDATDLCNRVAFLSDGELRAVDHPQAFIMKQGAKTVTYTYRDGDRLMRKSSNLHLLAQNPLFARLIQSNSITSMHTDEPTLADVFTELTGGRLEP